MRIEIEEWRAKGFTKLDRRVRRLLFIIIPVHFWSEVMLLHHSSMPKSSFPPPYSKAGLMRTHFIAFSFEWWCALIHYAVQVLYFN